MKASLIRLLVLVAAVVAGCATPPASQRAESPDVVTGFRALDALAAAGKHDAVIAQADQQLSRESDPAVRSRLQLRRARALQASDHPRSAVLGFQHAVDELPSETGDLASEAWQAWGDADIAAGRWREALLHYERALDAKPGNPRVRDDLVYSGYIAARGTGSTSAMSAWKKRLRVFSGARLVAVESRVLPKKPAPKPEVAAASKLAPGSIPDDPSLLLPGVHRRAEWGAAGVRPNADPMLPITRVTVHHSAMSSTATWPAAVGSEIREIQSFHQNSKGWADIGYHFIIDAGGGVWEARPLRWQGAHEGPGLNRGAIGICLLGNFEQTSVPAAQQAALTRTLDSLRKHFGLEMASVRTHGEVRPDPTECPGHALQDVVDRYRRGTAADSLARQ